MTASSIASIKTKQNLRALESEFLQMRSSSGFAAACTKYPDLQAIESFSSGMKATMTDVIMHLNPKSVLKIGLSEPAQDLESQRNDVYEKAKKV